MHCCTGNAARTLYYLWESMVEHADGRLRVNLLLNRASRWADVDSHLPYAGQVDVKVKRPLTEVLLRVPEWVSSNSSEVSATRGGAPVELAWHSRHVSLGRAQPGDTLSLKFPIAERSTRMARLLSSPDHAKMMGRAGRELVEGHAISDSIQ